MMGYNLFCTVRNPEQLFTPKQIIREASSQAGSSSKKVYKQNLKHEAIDNRSNERRALFA